MDLTVDDLVTKFRYPGVRRAAERFGFEMPETPNEERFAIPTSSLPKDGDSEPLCGSCQGMTTDSLQGDMGYQHSADLEDLIRSARSCPLCSLMETQICTAVTFHAQRQVRFTDAREAMDAFARITALEELFVAKPTRIILKVEDRRPTDGFNTLVIGTVLYSLVPGVKAFASHLGRLILHNDTLDSPQPLRPRGSDQDIMNRLGAWLNKHEPQEPHGDKGPKSSPLPTRVLDLGEPRGEYLEFLESDLFLVETAGRHGRYATLSYSWGGYRDTRTLKGNYNERLDGIQFKLLPVVFSQAIKITRAMGIRYLWIDALCIIQDDAEDWRVEAGRMSDVYWNCVCRLAITDSKDPTEGFFPPREYPSVRVPHLKAPKPLSGIDGLLGDNYMTKTEEGRLVLKEKIKEFLSLGRQGHFGIQLESGENLGNRTALAMPQEDVPDGYGSNEGTLGNISRDGNILRKLTSSSNYDLKSDEPSDEQLGGSQRGQSRDTSDKDGAMSKMIDEIMTTAWDSLEDDIQSSMQETLDEATPQAYLTIPRSYAVDVDRGHLNTRGWVLQERLLAPRTIHFTRHHIYCEDTHDICGEDWVCRYFTWMSCIYKTTRHSQVDLFPERSSFEADGGLDGEIWRQVFNNNKPDEQHDDSPWLTIAANFSKCQLTFDSDRLAAIAGLVNKKKMHPQSPQLNGRNFCGLWEQTLHMDLAWISRRGESLEYLHKLNLPSWAWISYKGPVSFVREPRAARKAGTPRRLPEPEFHLVEADVPSLTAPVPFAKPASLTLDVTLRKMQSISTAISSYGTEQRSRMELAKASPFDFDPRTKTIPTPLAAITDCQELYNESKKLIGFVSFDDGTHPVGDLFCAHLSTLKDEAMAAARQELSRPRVDAVDLGDYQRPILAYALVLTSLEKDIYRRVGLAEVNYHWMTSGDRSKLRLL
ncbi:unnamed protein product [Clonostachys rosea f. rosea IK726]|uniref:Heterokaryon incompatibility domain-containing protein n=2 Tax=Bionectria ochroleuca TaxID=29856 RepID=A0A0B7JRW8_BIOOC|nr:unnamed protein product [Clonostachys rosea f. rosea IK726]